MKHWRRTAVRITLFYLLFGSLWIFATDWVANWALDGSEIWARVQTVKGVAYVLVTTGFVWFLLRIFLSRLWRTKAAVSDVQRRLGMLAEQMAEGVAVAQDGRIVWANKAFARMLSLSPGDVAGREVSSLPLEPPASAPGQERASFDAVVPDQEGRRRDLEVVISGLTWKGEPARQILLRDITERKAAERALRSSRKRYRRMAQSINEMFFVTAESGTILDCSPSVEEVLGYERDEVIGRNIVNYYADKSRRRQLLDRLHAQGAVSDFELELINASGDPVPCAANCCLMYEQEADENRLVGTLRNIAERRALERRLRQTQRMESLGQLAGGVAHDFNNMLSAIMGYADLAQRELEGEPAVQEDIRQVLEASQRAEHLTRQLLAFSRRQVLEPEVVDLNEIMEDVAGMLGRVIGEQIELSLERAGEPVPTYVDPGGVEQVATNLVLNARDAMPEGGRIVLSTARTEVQETVTCEVGKMPPGEYARLTVSDTGAGMDEHTRSHMFEPFFTTREDGTGLGLATVYGTVRQSGGYLCVDSAVGEGSTFHIFLRLADESVTRDEPEQKERPHADGEETVLVVDDEEAVRAVSRRILNSAGYVVLEAADGQEAMELVADYTGGIDLVLTDVVMPRMGGAELAEKLVERQPDIRVIFMSGYPGEDLPPGLGGGMDGNVMSKPFTAEKLLPRVRQVLDASEG